MNFRAVFYSKSVGSVSIGRTAVYSGRGGRDAGRGGRDAGRTAGTAVFSGRDAGRAAASVSVTTDMPLDTVVLPILADKTQLLSAIQCSFPYHTDFMTAHSPYDPCDWDNLHSILLMFPFLPFHSFLDSFPTASLALDSSLGPCYMESFPLCTDSDPCFGGFDPWLTDFMDSFPTLDTPIDLLTSLGLDLSHFPPGCYPLGPCLSVFYPLYVGFRPFTSDFLRVLYSGLSLDQFLPLSLDFCDQEYSPDIFASLFLHVH